MKHKTTQGFSLVELLIYAGIISIIAIVFFRVLGVSTRVQVSQVAINEVANQTNFVMQTIQRLIRESSLVVVSDAAGDTCIEARDDANDNGALLGTDQPCLKLRMQDSAGNPTDRDPVFIWKDEVNGDIRMKQGGDPTSTLTTDKVTSTDNALTFRKYTNYPAHDTIEIALTLNYNSENPQSQAKRVAKTAVSRVSAATFDSPLLSGTSQFGTTFDIGLSTQRWANAFVGNLDVSGNANFAGTITQPGNFETGVNGRGMMVVFAQPGSKCEFICQKHTGPDQCFGGYSFAPTGIGGTFLLAPYGCNTPTPGSDGGALCMCY